MSCAMWHVTLDIWHMTCNSWWRMNIFSKLQLPSFFFGLGLIMFWRFGEKVWPINYILRAKCFCYQCSGIPSVLRSKPLNVNYMYMELEDFISLILKEIFRLICLKIYSVNNKKKIHIYMNFSLKKEQEKRRTISAAAWGSVLRQRRLSLRQQSWLVPALQCHV